jgi:hypothetical protein
VVGGGVQVTLSEVALALETQAYGFRFKKPGKKKNYAALVIPPPSNRTP